MTTAHDAEAASAALRPAAGRRLALLAFRREHPRTGKVDYTIELFKRKVKDLIGLRDKGLKVVVVQKDELVVTCYRPYPEARKWALRRGSENGFKRERRDGPNRGK